VNGIRKFSNTTKIGLFIETIGIIAIIVLILLNKPVPDVIMWIFSIGLVIVLITVLFTKKTNV